MSSLTAPRLITELSTIIDGAFAKSMVESYVEMQQRFLLSDWKPAELDGGRLCEAIARGLHQLDTSSITHSKLPGKICDRLEDDTLPHVLTIKDRHHLAKVIRLLYKFRSDRGAVHISPFYSANEMDSVLVLHVGKWLFSEFLRLAWNKDRQIIAETIQRIVKLEHSLIHELDGKPLVLAKGISAPEEVLLLLNHAQDNRMSKSSIHNSAFHKASNVNVAISRLIKEKEVRIAENGDVALTTNGQIRVFEEIIPKWSPYR